MYLPVTEQTQSWQLWYPVYTVGELHSNFPYLTLNLEQSKSYESALDSCIDIDKDLLSVVFWLTQVQLFSFVFNRLSLIINLLI